MKNENLLKGIKSAGVLTALLLLPGLLFASGSGEGLSVGPVRIEFIFFALTLLGVALFHNKTMQVALTGLAAVILFKTLFMDFSIAAHLFHNHGDAPGEWHILLNLLGLLLGFAVLAKHFEESGIPQVLPKFLPDGWKGGFVLLVLIFIMSAFLDNIAAAMIGGTIAAVVFKGKVHIGYLAAIVAASNAGGAGSVVGDTTTTMMWIDGVSAMDVSHAFVGAFAALFAFGFIASFQQDKYQRIQKDETVNVKILWSKVFVVALILAGAIATNILLDFPSAGVWIAILAGTLITKTPWREISHALKGSIFLLSLVLIASMMPVDELPQASWQTAFSLGFISSVFDNIPLTKLALVQGGYDWGILAYAVGFGGSMIWFGSSAGVAISNIYPEAKSVGNWIKHGWHVTVAYVIGFFIMLGVVGWHPHDPHKEKKGEAVVETPLEKH